MTAKEILSVRDSSPPRQTAAFAEGMSREPRNSTAAVCNTTRSYWVSISSYSFCLENRGLRFGSSSAPSAMRGDNRRSHVYQTSHLHRYERLQRRAVPGRSL